ncbi:MAG: hypothetical protein ACK44W_00575, partial [Planctomycetota bacterium]
MKYAVLALALLGAAGVWWGSRRAQADLAAPWEIRVFVMDKEGKPVDISAWSGTLTLKPKEGTERTLTLEKIGGAKPAAPEPKAAEKEPVCGQVKEMDRYYVELAVLNPATPMAHGGEPAPSAERSHPQAQSYSHTHGGGYFKTSLQPFLGDFRQKAVHFTADLAFIHDGRRMTVSGFSYPHGLYEDVLQKVMDEHLKKARDAVRARDQARWQQWGRDLLAIVHALPPLSFEKAQDRAECEKAREECMAACRKLQEATSPEQASQA